MIAKNCNKINELIYCEGTFRKMKKYEGKKSNVIGNLIKKYREEKGFEKIEVSRMLQLHAVYLDSTELKRIEDGTQIVKDFELIALCKVLDINYEDLKNCIE
jgi:hypothetical protein